MIPIIINQTIIHSSPLVKEGREGSREGKRQVRRREEGGGLELPVKNISLEMFSFTLCIINNFVPK